MPPAPEPEPDALVRTVRELEPVRAADLATWTGRPVVQVATALKELERRGKVRRDGEFWSSVVARTAPPAAVPAAPPQPPPPPPTSTPTHLPRPYLEPDSVDNDTWSTLARLVPDPAPPPTEPHFGHVRYRIVPPEGPRAPFLVRPEIVRVARRGGRELQPLRWPSDVAGLAVIRGVRPQDEALHTALATLDELLLIGEGAHAPLARAREVARVVALLAECDDVRFADEPVRVDLEPLAPRLVGTRREDGHLVLSWTPTLRAVWTVGGGYALTAEGTLRPLADEVPARVKRRLLRPLPVLEPGAVGAFVEKLVVDGGLEVDLPPDLLAPVAPERSWICLRLWEEEVALCVGWAVRYDIGPAHVDVHGGRPGRLARIPGGGVFLRDARFEAATARVFRLDVGVAGNAARLFGDDAYDFLVGLDDLAAGRRWTVLGVADLLRFRTGGRLAPRMRFGEDEDWFDLDLDFVVDELRASLREVLDAWREGKAWVTLASGAVALLPDRWLAKHGELAAELLAVREHRRQLGPWVAVLVAPFLDEAARPVRWDRVVARLAAAPKVPETRLQAELRPYQLEGYAWLARLRDLGFGAVLADDMGLGKTVQALALLADTASVRGAPSLVVAPRSVVHNWVDEAARFAPQLRVHLDHGPQRGSLTASADLVVTTFGTLREDQDAFADRDWRIVVLDEAQVIKNPRSQVAMAVARLRSRGRLALTGTPIENDLIEFYSILDFVNPGFFGSQQDFRQRYLVPIQERGDEEARARLLTRIRPFVLRRTKRQVTPELPDVQWTTLRCTLSPDERRLYDRVRDAVRASVLGLLEEHGFAKARLDVLTQLNRLRIAATDVGALTGDEEAQAVPTSAKVGLLMRTLEMAIAEGHRCLVFTQWLRVIDRVEQHLQDEFETRGWGYEVLDGRTRRRKERVDRFQRPDGPPVFLVSLKAGGVGLNLAAADQVFLLDPWWNPATERQAVDRVHRIGQDRKVTVYRMLADDTIEDRILRLQDRKRDLFDALLERNRLDQVTLDEADVRALLDELEP